MSAKKPAEAASTISVRGIVQGVGFRPFVHRLATSLELTGWVLNSTAGVTIEVEGDRPALKKFVEQLSRECPPLAAVKETRLTPHEPHGYGSFTVKHSSTEDEAAALVSPDASTCAACMKEVLDAGDRRSGYPFTNCTDCGPRFTIMGSLPYDRERTTMQDFQMCQECRAEYGAIEDRRYHAQPNACPACGPRVGFLDCPPGGDPISRAAALLREGEIVAVKGLGGFHLACDAASDACVVRLREAKGRDAKPFAVMCRSTETVEELCCLGDEERQVLESPAHPIVLLEQRKPHRVAEAVAPRNRCLGVMLPYTPLHHLLLAEAPPVLVMTSGNFAGQPLISDDVQAREKLFAITPHILTHDRRIATRCDDSVVRFIGKRFQVLRRARGYAPLPVELPGGGPSMLACGAQSKSTFTLTRDRQAFVSQHIGDVEDEDTSRWFREAVAHLCALLAIEPEAVACDMHPGYLTTVFALEQAGLPVTRVQHHHAHIASCMAEHGMDGKVLGVSFDGTGYGTDGTVWGGEFLACTYARSERLACLLPVPMPGGEMAVREPYRMAAAHLGAALGPRWWKRGIPGLPQWPEDRLELLERMAERRVNSPLTSSCGRLFDAVSSMLGLRDTASYEGQAAIELEMAADRGEHPPYEYGFEAGGPHQAVDLRPTVRRIVEDLGRGTARETIAARFHATVADLVAQTCRRVSGEAGTNRVVLSGGVFQNRLLAVLTGEKLEQAGFSVYQHSLVPPNDGGISLGQAAVAMNSANNTVTEH